ncbi:MAG: sn-glycerol-3-phosphate ABC transporter ATP-binding protein UgpC [Gammaproteobacteria bacterium]|nr:sn-glycerol-3-phosphate ABC transporter ATP-binding protein UgpC [Gammaproteobacteria bacterium]MCP4878955.1 sn-glycerol-3-phosphate ABC transporter ATP-binding protein UgpC [Gammaproteobacteria bacterium]
MATVALQNINKCFNETQVLDNINLDIKDKEFIVFVGPSGCGKTTLLRIIAGLEEASEGAIIIDNQDVSNSHPIDRGISMVFQSYALYPHLSVFENIAFPLRVAKLPEPELRQRVQEAASVLQLENRLDHKPGELSGGQRQRVAIGRSIVRNPKVFLFDEPLSNLDAALRGDMRVELAKLHHRLNATMIYVTHDQVEAMTMADRIVVLNDGKVEQYGSPMELYHHPKTLFVANFIGQPNMNFLTCQPLHHIEDSLTIDVSGYGHLTLPVHTTGANLGSSIELGIRPEDIQLTDHGEGFTMHIDVIEQLGGSTIAHGQVNDKDFCAVLPGDANIKPGGEIKLAINASKCHIFDADGKAMRRLQSGH